MSRLIILTIILAGAVFIGRSQSVSISTIPSIPDPSAMLDIKQSNKGLLIPRVFLLSIHDTTTIPNPAESLLVYNISSEGSSLPSGFYYWSGSAWNMLNTGTNSWSLTGNSGIVNGTNFIGTLTNVPFNIRVDNQQAGKIDKNMLNTFWGYHAGYADTAISLSPIANSNTAIGTYALSSNLTGGSNTAIGAYALQSSVNGAANTAIGYGSLIGLTVGAGNTALGYLALGTGSGSYNTATGSNALYYNSNGDYNTANGYFALDANTTGIQNSAVGYNALTHNITGNFNTAMGGDCLTNNDLGSGNSAFGYNADVSVIDLTNATAIGYNTLVNASNKVRLGNNSVTVIEGKVPFSNVSDARFKYNINNDVPGLEFITQLKPVTYYFDDEKLDSFTLRGVNKKISKLLPLQKLQRHTGFLAQDVEKITKQLRYQFDGLHAPENANDYYSLAYSQFIMPIVKSIQQQQSEIQELKLALNAKQDELRTLNERIARLENAIKALTK